MPIIILGILLTSFVIASSATVFHGLAFLWVLTLIMWMNILADQDVTYDKSKNLELDSLLQTGSYKTSKSDSINNINSKFNRMKSEIGNSKIKDLNESLYI